MKGERGKRWQSKSQVQSSHSHSQSALLAEEREGGGPGVSKVEGEGRR